MYERIKLVNIYIMSDTSWKNLGKKAGGNMKNYRNVRMDKAFYNNGKWGTFYSDDDIKRLAYYNIDLPHVVGIGTKTPFSKLSFGDSSGSGYHPSSLGNIESTTGLTPGKVTAIAMHEKSISKALDNAATSSFIKGQDFAGFSYVNQIKSVRKRIDDTNSASGVAIYANKSSDDKTTFMLRSYYHKNILAFGDLLHRIHPLAGQGFNMTIRDINFLIKIIKEKINLSLPFDSSINNEFEKKTKHKNYIFSTSIDLIYELFNFDRKLNNSILSKSLKFIGRNASLNKIFTKIADEGINF